MSRRLLMPILLLMLSLNAAANDGWESIRQADERGEVSTWVRPVEGNPIKAFRGQVEVPYPMLTALAVLSDIPNFPAWVFQCHAAEMREAWGKEHARIMIKGIWPVSDRDVIVHSRLEQDPATLAITVYSRATDQVLPPQDGYVRLPALDNIFRLEPLPDGWTRITFQTFVDPGGSIPAWLANFVSTRAPLTTLRGMKEQMENEKYHIRSMEELPFTLPDAGEMRLPEQPPVTSQR